MKPSEDDMAVARELPEWAHQQATDIILSALHETGQIDDEALALAIAAALAGEREKVFERVEQRLIQEHTAGETGDDCAAGFDEGWLSGAWNAVNTVRELRALNESKP